MDNINYILKENSQENNEFDISVYQNELDQNDLDYNYSVEELYILYTSYSVRSLSQILEFYNITKYNINNKKKLVKDEIIQLLVLFEQDTSNKYLVNKRRRLWNNIDELKNDAYFKKFIMFTI